MRSPSRLPPLNSSTTALFSSSSLSSSFSLSSPSSLFTSSPSLSSHPSLLFWILTVSLLLFNVAATPVSTSPAHKQRQVQGQSDIRTVQVYVNDSKIGNSNNNKSLGFQMDQPPRDFSNGLSFPTSWGEQFRRPVRLRTLNSQYLQIYEGKISGTKVERPIFSILFFTSHEMFVVIETLHTREFLCMDRESRLYLSKKVNEECYVEEESLYHNGSQAYNYKFVNYSTKAKPLYLGINCQPLLGTATNSTKKSSRFFKDTKLSRTKALQIRNDVLRGDSSQYKEAAICKRQPSKRAERRSKMKKMKRRWCLKAARTIPNTAELYENCTREFKKECSENSHKKKRECACELLMDLLFHRTKGKKKCLVDRITRWVVKRNERPNRKFIRHLADLLVPRYSMIMKRLQKGRRRKNKGEADKAGPTPHPRRHHHGQRGRGNGRRRRRRKKTVIKLNLILSRYRNQLILSKVATTAVDTSSAPRSSSSSSSRSSGSSSSSLSSSSSSSPSPRSKSNSKRRHPKPNIKVSIDSALKSSSRKTNSGASRHSTRRRRKIRPKARPG